MSKWEELHKLSIYNRDACLTSSICGCFHCTKLVEPKDIKEWIDEGKTALCPKCGIDSILPVDKMLKLLNEFWFSEAV